jgi:hypothetical protein
MRFSFAFTSSPISHVNQGALTMTEPLKVSATPKVFISYSWSSPGHQESVRKWADRLLSDGIQVIIDIYDLQEGHDKFHFMERMVTDPDMTHVLVVSDRVYAEKADMKKAGVGTESQIISSEVYGKVEQSKFIPIVCGFKEDAEPYLPVFLKSRIWIDFSSPEAVNQNWEKLVRLLHGKPAFIKPQVGKIPTYLSDDKSFQASPAAGKLAALKQAYITESKSLRLQREDFISLVITAADSLRVRKDPGLTDGDLATKTIEDCARFKDIRNLIIDWVLIEGGPQASNDFQEALLGLHEKLLVIKSKPADINRWVEGWFDAQRIFAYETFLYIIAALLKSESFPVLHEVLVSHYLRPEADRYSRNKFTDFQAFNTSAESLNCVLAGNGGRFLSPAAEQLRKQADRTDLPFGSILQADLLAFLMALISPDGRWFPQTLYYNSQGDFSFFLRATQHRYFLKLAAITGEADADMLREKVTAGYVRMGVAQWSEFEFHTGPVLELMNLSKLDSLR